MINFERRLPRNNSSDDSKASLDDRVYSGHHGLVRGSLGFLRSPSWSRGNHDLGGGGALGLRFPAVVCPGTHHGSGCGESGHTSAFAC